MENLNFESFQILVFLIPGFISAYIMDLTITREKRNIFENIIESLIFSFLIYSIVAFFIRKFPVFVETIENQGAKISYLRYDNMAFLSVVLISLILPLIISSAYNHDWSMRIIRKLKITHKTSRKSTWNDAFLDSDVHIIINFSNGRRIYGWPKYFSEDPAKPFIYLSSPSWIEKDTFIDLDVSGILITDKQEIESIEFLKN